jgi:hypothetical protein
MQQSFSIQLISPRQRMELFILTICLIQDWDFQLISLPLSFSDNEERFRKLGYICSLLLNITDKQYI